MPPIHIEDVPTTESIFDGPDQDGNFHFPTELSYSGVAGRTPLIGRQIIALALTEFCCRDGIGKVYWVPLEDSPAWRSMPKSIHKTTCAYTYHRLPKIIYVPFVWGKKDQTHWHAMKHSDRLWLLNARSGGVMRKENVMPIDCTYEAIEKKEVRLNGYNRENTGCAAIVAIVPKAYIGWCEEFQRDAPRYEIAGSSMNDGEGAWYVAKGEVIERYRENNVHGLVQRLWDMYFIQKPRSLMRFEDILRHVIRFRKVWLDAKMEGSN